MTLHAMIDIETFSTKPNAIVPTVGVAFFDPAGSEIHSSHTFRLNVKEQAKMGRHMDPDTVYWWLGQADDARAALIANQTQDSLAFSVGAIRQAWVDVRKVETISGVWGNGPAFDLTIIETLMEEVGVLCPWRFWDHRDVRTMKYLAPGVERRKPTVAHDAEADAVAQALWVQDIYRHLQQKPA